LAAKSLPHLEQMTLIGILKRLAPAVLVGFLAVAFSGPYARATIVRFHTSVGDVDVRLFNSATPLNVANFLNYVNSGRYNGTFIHRSVANFVIQGGGYTYQAQTNTMTHIAQFDQVQNEFGISNLRGTIAMAKLPAPEDGGPPNGGPDSATSEFFFNLSDSNASNLDNQNGGFTVFGQVLVNGMSTVDAIAALPRTDVDPPPQTTFDAVPLRSGSSLANKLVYLTNVQVLNLPAADYDRSGTVNSNDYTVWQTSFNSTTDVQADGNGNAHVDAADYVLWRKPSASGSGTGLAASIVPEPSTAFLLVCGTLMLGISRRRNVMHGGR
jgi:peptidyl-prolyl cis-trans isomerase A (cyclophilin A)